MPKTIEAPVVAHPIVTPRASPDDDDGCTEGLEDYLCDEVCTENKRRGTCRCKRRKRDGGEPRHR